MIKVEGLCYRYRTPHSWITALRDVFLSIDEGAFVAIMGANGSGKTTLARCLNGLLRPTEGRVGIDGLRTDRAEEIWAIRQKVGMIFQNPDNQLVSTMVEREIAFGLENLGVPSDEIHCRVDEALARFELQRYRNYPPHRLSGGEKQRLAVASVWAMRPKYIVLDEPTSLLDSKGCREVMDVLHELADDPEIAIVHITQSPEEAAEADRLIVMDQGQIVMDDAPAVVFAQGDALRAIGLEVPKVSQLADKLRMEGISLPDNILDAEAMIRALMEYHAVPPLGNGLATDTASPVSYDSGRIAEHTPSSTIIETRKLCHVYNPKLPTEQLALSDVDLAISPGEFLALTGSTGSGKTTLVQHFNGLLQPTSGQVLVEGIDLWQRGVDLQSVRQQIGLIFQFPELQLFEETAAKDVAFGPRNLGMSEDQVDQCVRRMFEAVQLDFDRFAHRSPFQLSGGEKRRLAIAGVLAMLSDRSSEQGRSVLVLDEPTAGLDHRGTRQIANILQKLYAEGRTIVIIAHDMDLVAELAQRVIVLDRGETRFDGTPREAFTQGFPDDIGLDRPWAARLANRLRASGWNVCSDVLNIEQLQKEVLKILNGHRRRGA